MMVLMWPSRSSTVAPSVATTQQRGNGWVRWPTSSQAPSPAAVAETPVALAASPKAGAIPFVPPAAEDWLKDTAIVTMAAGDDAGRLVVALVRSLRDVETRVPHIVVMLSRGGLGSRQCQNMTWKIEHGRDQVRCDAPDTVAEEIIDAEYVAALTKMGAEVMVIDQIPQTPYTNIPGGPQTFWGMALNKLRVFGLTQFRKLLWMDGDTLVLKNIDHLLREPMFTAAFTYDCCNAK